MTAGPWGISPFGLGSWGAATLVSVVRCTPLTTHSIYVQLAAPPIAESVIGNGDALNPASWFVKLDDDSRTWTVIAVRQISVVEYELRVNRALMNVRKLHKAGSFVLRNGIGSLIEAPYSASFLGVVADTDILASPTGSYDLANQPAGFSDSGGTLTVLSGGNYARVQGPEFYRKLVLRRLSTTPGAYFHIARDDYGMGLQIKRPLRISELIAFQTQVEMEMLKEPGISSCVAQATIIPGGGLSLKISVKTKNGEPATVTVEGSTISG